MSGKVDEGFANKIFDLYETYNSTDQRFRVPVAVELENVNSCSTDYSSMLVTNS